MDTRIKKLALYAALAMMSATLMIPFFQSLEEKSLRAEVRVILGYMATLQSAYHTDVGRYAYFESPYGAPVNGQENCLRPKGAEELGFTLVNCEKDPLNGGLRYAYSAQPDGANFIGYGRSGSDIKGIDYVCGVKGKMDHWQIGPEKKARHVRNCK